MKRGTLVSGSFCGHPGAMWQLLGASRNFLEPGAPGSFLGLFGSLGQPMEALWSPWAAYGSLWDSLVLPGACSPSESFGALGRLQDPLGIPGCPWQLLRTHWTSWRRFGHKFMNLADPPNSNLMRTSGHLRQ